MAGLLAQAAHLLRGKHAENQAQEFLSCKGLTLICRNYRCKQGELDLIMRDGETLAFIEVRYRKSDTYGSALESITRNKQACIIAATQHYLMTHPEDCPLRFDVIAITGSGKITWIKNAF